MRKLLSTVFWVAIFAFGIITFDQLMKYSNSKVAIKECSAILAISGNVLPCKK